MAAALAQADVIIDHGLNAVAASERANALIAHDLDWLRQQKSPYVRRKRSEEAGGWGPTKKR